MSHPRPPAREPQVLLSDLTAELLWPRALRAPAMALRPARVALGMAAVFLATLIGQLSTLWSRDAEPFAGEISGPISSSLQQSFQALLSFSSTGMQQAVASLALLPGRLITERPIDTIVLGIPIVLVLVLFGGTISRAVAVEYAAARITDWPSDFRVSTSKAGWSLAAVIAPLALAGVLLGLVMLGGFSLGVPVLNIIGAVLYAAAVGVAFFALCVLILQALALPMIVPALMCEGTDAYDAVQRSYAYILARPLRLLAHAAILLVLGIVSLAIFAAVARGSVELADWAASRLTSEAGERVLARERPDSLAATQPVAHAIIRGWRAVVDTAIAGFALSYFFAAGTILYLHARRICDGQGTGDIWNPESTQD